MSRLAVVVCIPVLALALVIGMWRPAEAEAAPSVDSLAHSACGALFVLSDICDGAVDLVGKAAKTAVGVVTNPVGTVVKAVGGGILGTLSQWVGDGAAWLVTQVADGIDAASSVNLDARWFREHYRWLAAAAALLLLPAFILAILHALLRQDGGLLARTFLLALPGALLVTALSVAVTQTTIAATDAISGGLTQGFAKDAGHLAGSISKVVGLSVAGGAGAPALFVTFLVGMVMALAALAVWLELLLRASAIYLAVAFLPLFLVMAVWPPAQRWARRLVDVLAALILSKLVIVAALALGFSAIASGDGISSVLAGAGLFILAAFCPFALLALLPVVAEAAHPQRAARQTALAASGAQASWQMATAKMGGAMRGNGGGGYQPWPQTAAAWSGGPSSGAAGTSGSPRGAPSASGAPEASVSGPGAPAATPVHGTGAAAAAPSAPAAPPQGQSPPLSPDPAGASTPAAAPMRGPGDHTPASGAGSGAAGRPSEPGPPARPSQRRPMSEEEHDA